MEALGLPQGFILEALDLPACAAPGTAPDAADMAAVLRLIGGSFGRDESSPFYAQEGESMCGYLGKARTIQLRITGPQTTI